MPPEKEPVTNSRSPQKVEVPPDSLIRRTVQLWQLVVGAIALPVPLSIWGWWTFRSIGPEQPAGAFAARFAVLAGGAAVVALLLSSVRCPQCRTRLLFRAMRAPEGLDAVLALLKRSSCDACGYRPPDDTHPPQAKQR